MDISKYPLQMTYLVALYAFPCRCISGCRLVGPHWIPRCNRGMRRYGDLRNQPQKRNQRPQRCTAADRVVVRSESFANFQRKLSYAEVNHSTLGKLLKGYASERVTEDHRHFAEATIFEPCIWWFRCVLLFVGGRWLCRVWWHDLLRLPECGVCCPVSLASGMSVVQCGCPNPAGARVLRGHVSTMADVPCSP